MNIFPSFLFLIPVTTKSSQLFARHMNLKGTDGDEDVVSAAPSDSSYPDPTEIPSLAPSLAPSEFPSLAPSGLASLEPSEVPSGAPSESPSFVPSFTPSEVPSQSPTDPDLNTLAGLTLLVRPALGAILDGTEAAAVYATGALEAIIKELIKAGGTTDESIESILATDGELQLVFDSVKPLEDNTDYSHELQEFFESPLTKPDFVSSFLGNIRKVIILEAKRLAGGNTVTSREVQTAVRLTMPGELAKFAVSEGTRAVTRFAAA